MSLCSWWFSCGHMWLCPRWGVRVSEPFPLGFCWCTWQCSIPAVQKGNGLDARGLLLINPLFVWAGITVNAQRSVGLPRVHQTQKMPPVATRSVLALNQNSLRRDIHHYLLCKGWEVFLFYFIFQVPSLGVEALYFLFTDFKHMSLKPMVEKCIDLSPV